MTDHPPLAHPRADGRIDAPAPGSPPVPTSSPGARLAWLIPGSILAVAAIILGTYNLLELLAHEVRTERTEFAAADVSSVEVNIGNGSVTIVGDASTTTIDVAARISDGWKATDVDVSIVGGVLEVHSSCPVMSTWCSTDFTITVPDDLPVRVDAGEGGVTARGLHGAIDLDTDNGRIEVSDVSGSIRLTNDNGSIIGRRMGVASVDASTENGRVELSFIEPPDDVRGRSHNGRVEVIVPDDEVAYRVQLDTDHGSTNIGVRTDPASSHTIDLATSNGSVTVRPPD
jgi:DUF4097 and DUF4098 domain-containing protein YvlB